MREETSADQASMCLCSPRSEHMTEQHLTDEQEADKEEGRGKCRVFVAQVPLKCLRKPKVGGEVPQ